MLADPAAEFTKVSNMLFLNVLKVLLKRNLFYLGNWDGVGFDTCFGECTIKAICNDS